MPVNSQTAPLETLEINAPSAHSYSLIWLHGLGASNDDFLSVASELEKLTHLPLRFVFPQAPLKPVTINNGYIMPAWYDIFSFDRESKVDEAGIAASVAEVRALIEIEKAKGVSADNIILAGFSQGGVIALSTLVAHPENVAAAIGLSCYLPAKNLKTPKKPTAVFVGHGLADEVVAYDLGEMAYDKLEQAGYQATFKKYAMGHSVSMEEVGDIAEWLFQWVTA